MKDKFGNEVNVGDNMYFIDQVHGKGYGSPYLRIGKIAKVEPYFEGHMATLEWEAYGNVFTEERKLTDIAKAYEEGSEMDNDNYTLIAHWKSIEYEYATCSNCGFDEYTDWNSTNEAKEKIGEFHNNYKFCPGCGAKMVGGRYHGK